MKPDLDILEKIDMYLVGALHEEDLILFEKEIEKNPELSEIVEVQRTANNIIVGNRLNEVKILMDKDFADGKIKINKNTRPNNLNLLGITLLIGTVCALTYFSVENTNKNKQHSLTTFQQENSLPVEEKKIQPAHDTEEKIFTIENTESYKEKFTISPKPLEKPEVEIEAPVSNQIQEEETLTSRPLPEIEVKTNTPEIKNPEISPKAALPVKPADTPVEENHSDEIKKPETFSFNPGYNETFTIPMTKGSEADFYIMDRSGKTIYREHIYGDRINVWDGKNLQGGISPANLYFYFLEYTNGEKESGQVIIY